MLHRYYDFDSVCIDTQNKYQILQNKYSKLQAAYNSNLNELTSIKTQLRSSRSIKMSNSNVLSNRNGEQGRERIEIYELVDYETQQQIQQMEQTIGQLHSQLKWKTIEFNKLESKYEDLKYENNQFYNSQSTGFNNTNSVGSNNSLKSNQSLEREIQRLNKIVAELRMELNKYKTREFDEDWLKQYPSTYQSTQKKQIDSSLNVFNMLDS